MHFFCRSFTLFVNTQEGVEQGQRLLEIDNNDLLWAQYLLVFLHSASEKLFGQPSSEVWILFPWAKLSLAYVFDLRQYSWAQRQRIHISVVGYLISFSLAEKRENWCFCKTEKKSFSNFISKIALDHKISITNIVAYFSKVKTKFRDHPMGF